MATRELKPLSYTPGPVTMLPVASRERDKRTIEWLLTVWSSQQYTLDKWDEAIRVIEEERIYERFPPEQPAGSLENLIKELLGFSVEESRLRIEDRANRAVPAGKPGGQPGNKNAAKNKDKNDNDNCQLRFKGGNDPAYLTSVIARDRPDILERMKQGEFRSVRAAAIEAGIVKDSGKITVSTIDPQKAAKTILNAIESGKITREFVNRLKEAL